MGRGGPRLPTTVEQAQEILAEQEFFVPRSELPEETDRRRAYVRRLHIVLAKTARRFEHSERVVAGERPPDSEPELPDGLREAEAYLQGQSFFISVADLPGDSEQVGEYVEELHLRLARAARGLTHNQRVLREREMEEEESGDGEGSGSTDEVSTAGDETAGEATVEDGAEEGSTAGAGGSTDSVSASDRADQTADTAGRGENEHTSTDSRPNRSAGGDAESTPGPDTEGETGPAESEESGTEDKNRFVYGRFGDQADDAVDDSDGEGDTDDEHGGPSEGRDTKPRGPDEGDEAGADGDGGAGEADSEPRSRTPDNEEGLERRQLLFGGAAVTVLVAAVGGGLVALLSGGDDGPTDPADGGDTGETTGGDDGPTDPADGGDGSAGDGTGGTDDGTDRSPAFELVDFEADAAPAEEYVELVYTGDGEQDISGYVLYDGEDGRAHPTRQGSLDPFRFPDGTTLSSGESVRVYTGPGDSGDGTFYWDYEVNIWNKGGDTVVLENVTGSVVLETEYGQQG